MSIEIIVKNCQGRLITKNIDQKVNYPYCNLALKGQQIQEYVSVKCEHYLRVRGMCAYKDREKRNLDKRALYVPPLKKNI